ncbi:spidroin-1-like [Iris pallida]|uniref:Spidroin-1-like n=1 Tax=Iris pallida TaxID=29817 RepID=A0AAX6DHY2_IRIPA|nr:spidroin-1-like [Iris pallida]KAJ6791356.1 spidroin-1-like [Iris pallida]KAJ6838556.1 spidroin-1-like [Iris pallida]
MMKSVPRFPPGNPDSCVLHFRLAALVILPVFYLLGWHCLDGLWIPGLFGNYSVGWKLCLWCWNYLVVFGGLFGLELFAGIYRRTSQFWVCPGIEEVLPKFLQIIFQTGFRK